jgi:carboxymethylenebutenolidase
MRAALKAAGKTSEIVLYDDAEHGFFADYRGSYQEKAAQHGWNRMLAWFRKHGV